MTDFDTVVVGGGAAGLSAATLLGRYRRDALVVDSRQYRNRWADQIHGYLGADSTDPHALLRSARDDLRDYPSVQMRFGRVASLSREGERFTVTLDGGRVTASTVVLATGVRDQLPQIDGFFDHYGTSVFHCPTCDGYEARGREVAVIGWGEHVTGFALDLLDWAAGVTIVTDGHTFEGQSQQRTELEHHGVGIIEQTARRLTGHTGELEGVELEDGRTVPCDLAFFSIGHDPVTELAGHVGCELTDDGYVVVDRTGATTVDGVYAAGDVTGGTQLVIVAAAEGAQAGTRCALSLR